MDFLDKPPEVDELDYEILTLIAKGCANAYGIQRVLDRKAHGNGLMYTSITKRLRKLRQRNIIGIEKQTKQELKKNIHGATTFYIYNNGRYRTALNYAASYHRFRAFKAEECLKWLEEMRL